MTKITTNTKTVHTESCPEDAGYRILAQDHYVSNCTQVTHVNNNDIVFGPSGAGKTRFYVKPNIMQATSSMLSMLVADTKGNLFEEFGELLKRSGFKVLLLDFKQMNSTCRWNPLDYIAYDSKRHAYSEVDIESIAKAISPTKSMDEIYWTTTAAQHLTLLISIVMDFLPKENHTLEYVLKLFNKMDTQEFHVMMHELQDNHPDCLASRVYDEIKCLPNADKTYSCVKSFLSSAVHCFALDPALKMYSHPNKFRFRDLGKRKTALFVNISDTDRSMDPLVSLFYSQALQDLCDFADHKCKGRLAVPVRFLLDDFATNITIPDFDKVISVIRSREISVSVILQSLSQLYSAYERYKGNTILENADNILYLGGQSHDTAEYVAVRANIPKNEVLNMPLDDAILMIRGQEAKIVKKYDLTQHPRYEELPEAKAKTTTSKAEETRTASKAEAPTEKQSTDSAQSA